jgi:tRNA pseudouridine(38-40) synthase
MVIEYDGTDFSGCQIQPSLRTVQGELERCICRLTGEQPNAGANGGGAIEGAESADRGGIRVVFASRTDKGVHARGQVALVRTCSELAWTDPAAFAKRLSAFLPEDMAVVSIAHAKPDFEPRSGTKGKWYRYTIACGASRPALGRHAHWFVPQPRGSGGLSGGDELLEAPSKYLNVLAMQRAASRLVGKPLDFTAFANVGKGAVSDGMEASSRDPVCIIDALAVRKAPAQTISDTEAPSRDASYSIIEVDIRGSRFLFNMVGFPIRLGARPASAKAPAVKAQSRSSPSLCR